MLTVFKRFASQETNPIILRLLHKNQSRIPFDRNAQRSWFNHFYVPHEGYAMYKTRNAFQLQSIKLKSYLRGYFEPRGIYYSQPIVYRTMAGVFIRMFTYHSDKAQPFTEKEIKSIEEALGKEIGKFQGPGTSGRSKEDNESQASVKVILQMTPLSSPILNAEILCHHMANQLKQRMSPQAIFDRIGDLIDQEMTKRVPFPGATGLEVIGLRLRIKGRPKGEEMAVKNDYIKGSCPKQDPEAWMDYGKLDIQLRSGKVGLKAWVHFQKPHKSDEEGNQELSLLKPDLDYDPKHVAKVMKLKKETEQEGLWNVQLSQNALIRDQVDLLKKLHQPDCPENSRFIW